jgi:type III restriction enzyme
MMAGFNFEKNLNHQTQAVDSTISVFKDLEILQSIGANKDCVNPLINIHSGNYADNIVRVQEAGGIEERAASRSSTIIDIMMETGTGKTYTYANQTSFYQNAFALCLN